MKYWTDTPLEQVLSVGPSMVTVPVGMTDRIALPSVTCWIRKLPVTCWPDVTSVARRVAIWVGALTLTTIPAVALPLASVTCVTVEASGEAGLFVCNA